MLVLLAAALAAQTPEPVAASQPAEQAKAGDKVICKRSAIVGTRAKKRRVCMTAREWHQAQNNVRDAANEYIHRANNAPATE